MKIDLDFLLELKKSQIIKVQKVPLNHNCYEYAIEEYDEGAVFGLIELEHQIVDEWDITIGHFGVSFDHGILVYYLKKGERSHE